VSLEKEIRALHESGMTRAEAAEQMGLTLDKFAAMLQVSGWKLKWKRKSTGGKHTINGVTDTLQGHANRLGLPVGTLRGRLERQQDVKAPPRIAQVTQQEAQMFTELRRQGIGAYAAAEQVGRPYNTLKNAAKKFCSDYDTVVEITQGKRTVESRIEALKAA